ncbi:MAG TPA: hypothetical protein VN428_21490 [Bryobacteraceae bacterium]|nr:hypothetical protein [Bryobacteraceae bacterium]
MRFGTEKFASTVGPSSLPAFYEWKTPGQSFSIQLSYEIIDRLHAEIMKGFWAVPKRGAEVGGVLLGKVVGTAALTAGEVTVFIDDYELVTCEHRRGPSYVLSEGDRKRIEKALRRTGGNHQAVGYFRSHTRPGLYLDEDDMAVIRSYFSNPKDVILLVRPHATRTSSGGFFFWEEEDMRRHSTYREFPFSKAELLKPLLDEPDAEPVAATPEATATAPQPVRERAAAPVRAAVPMFAFGSRLNLKKAAAVAAVVLGVGAMEYQILGVRGGPGSGGEGSPALKVERNGNYLQVSWDRNAPIVARSKEGLLVISDGQFRKEIKLEAAHLRGGTVAYAPSGEDVNFRLELKDGQRSVSESLRVVTASPADGRGMQPAVSEPAMPRTDEEEAHPQFKNAGQVAAADRRVPAENAIRPKPARKARVSRFFDDGL